MAGGSCGASAAPVVPAGLGSLPGQGRTCSPRTAAGPGLAGISPEIRGCCQQQAGQDTESCAGSNVGAGVFHPGQEHPESCPHLGTCAHRQWGHAGLGYPGTAGCRGCGAPSPARQRGSSGPGCPEAKYPELQQRTRTQAPRAAWGSRTVPRARHGVGSAAPWDAAPAPTHCSQPLPHRVLAQHPGATYQDISFAARSRHEWKRFAKPPSPAGGEVRAEGPSPQLKVPPAALAGATQKPFPKWTSHQQHWPQREGACSLQHTMAEEPRGAAQPHLPKPWVPRMGMVQQARILLGTPRGSIPVPRHPSQGAEGKTPSHYNSSR